MYPKSWYKQLGKQGHKLQLVQIIGYALFRIDSTLGEMIAKIDKVA